MGHNRGKKIQNAYEQFDRKQHYSVQDAIALVKTVHPEQFDASVDVAFRLGIDPRQADQQLRGAFILPHGTGKTVRIAVFAKGAAAQAAQEAGATIVGDSDLIAKVADGWFDFDVAIATPDMMAQLGKIGRVLGPRGLMPNPKTGTVTMDTAKAVSEILRGKVEYRSDKTGNVHIPIGRVSFSDEALVANLQEAIDTIMRAKPASAKGVYMQSVVVSSTMGPGIKIRVE